MTPCKTGKCYITLIYQPCNPPDQDYKSEIIALENQLVHYEKVLDDLIEKNAVFGETKIIFNEVRLIAEKLIALKKAKESNEPQ